MKKVSKVLMILFLLFALQLINNVVYGKVEYILTSSPDENLYGNEQKVDSGDGYVLAAIMISPPTDFSTNPAHIFSEIKCDVGDTFTICIGCKDRYNLASAELSDQYWSDKLEFKGYQWTDSHSGTYKIGNKEEEFYSYYMFKMTAKSSGSTSVRAGLWSKGYKDKTKFTVEIPITISKSEEEQELDNQNAAKDLLENYYKTPMDQIYEDTYYMYVCSLLYNDAKNGNNALFMNFLKNNSNLWHWITWITDHDDTSSEVGKSVREALNAGYDYYQATPDDEQFVEKYDRLVKAQENAHNALLGRKTEIDEAIEDATVALQEKINGSNRSVSSFKDVFDDIRYYTSKIGQNDSTNKLTQRINLILTIITDIGMVVAVLMSAIIGIKYMIGSVEEKAEYKKDMIPYLIGAILLFGISAILRVLQQFGQNINQL